MKKLLFCLMILVSSLQLFAVTSQINSESVKAYRKALENYDNLEYGKALKYAEDAILYRRQESETELKVLNNALTPKKVVDAGTEIDNVLKVLQERGEKESIRIINYYIKLKGKDFFDDSIENVRKYIDEIKTYPEAYKLIGDIYKLEGEYQFAEEYYNLALDHANILDIPDEKYEILYMLAQISKLQDNLPQMEVRLLNILVDDPYFKDKALFNSMMGTIKANKKGSMEKFFNLYRASSYYCLKTYSDLVEYYYEQGETDKACRLSALTVLTGFTRIYNILKTRNPEYEYTSLGIFFQELSYYPDIIEWGTKNNVWKSFYQFAEITNKEGYTVFSKDLLKVMVQFLPETYWQKTSVILLDSIN